jgi:xanthine/uracil/vitamin C permease (AzgA family)
MCISSALCFAISAILFTICVSQIGGTTINVLSGSLQYGIFVGIGLFSLNIVLNTLVNKGFRKQRAQQN